MVAGFRLGLAGVTLFIGSACAASTWEMPSLPSADRVVIQIQNRDIGEIKDASVIQRISAFVDQNRSGWERPWPGIPIPDVVAAFYKGDEILGYFGVGWVACNDGGGFFWTLRFGPGVTSGNGSQAARLPQCEAFVKLLGIPDAQLPPIH
jgi:hypothetical protein